jgi:hypothetical protein
VVDCGLYSRMMYERWQSIDPNAPPSDILDFDKYPMPTEE